MNFLSHFVFLALALGTATPAFANLNVVTSTTDLAAITREVGGSEINVESISKGSQDPHFIEAKPSYMVKVSHADLLISVGLELEIGWIPPLVAGARNPKVSPGQKGFLEVGPEVQPLEVPHGKVTRAEGDVHPLGNPHVTMDPIRAGEIAGVIAERLGQLDSAHSAVFAANAKAFQARMKEKTAVWKSRIEKSGVRKAVSYHKTLTYFFDRFGIENPAILEPKPGIPPTSGHILEVIQTMKDQKIGLILVENFFDPSVTKKILSEMPSVRSVTVPVAVGGEAGIEKMDDLYETLVKAVTGS
jgi:zinc/manganese transport system substrate-binding protein